LQYKISWEKKKTNNEVINLNEDVFFFFFYLSSSQMLDLSGNRERSINADPQEVRKQRLFCHQFGAVAIARVRPRPPDVTKVPTSRSSLAINKAVKISHGLLNGQPDICKTIFFLV
jgi:hypothetical protein